YRSGACRCGRLKTAPSGASTFVRVSTFHARTLKFDLMAKATKFEVGDRILVEHVVLAVWDDGHITYEIHGTSTVIKATVRGDDDSIREVLKGTRPKQRLTLDEDEVD